MDACEIIRVDSCKRQRSITLQLYRADLVNLPDSFTGVRKTRRAVRIKNELVNRTGNLLGGFFYAKQLIFKPLAFAHPDNHTLRDGDTVVNPAHGVKQDR